MTVPQNFGAETEKPAPIAEGAGFLADRPLCECHAEPMLWNKDSRLRAGGRWKCNVIARAAFRRWYENLSNAEYRALCHRIRTGQRERRIADLERRLQEHGQIPH